MEVIAFIGTLATGSLATLLVKVWIDRRTTSRSERAVLYRELLIVLTSRRRATYDVSNHPLGEYTGPADLPQERIDELDARMLIDASPEVRKLATPCFNLLHRFWLSYSFKMPIEVDQFGLFLYRGDLVRGKPEEARDMVMRMSLGKIHDEYGSCVDRLAAQIRKELHGRAE